MLGKIISENTLKSGEKEYFCSTLNLREFGVNIGDEVEFTPKGSVAVITKITQKSQIGSNLNSQNSINLRTNSNTFSSNSANSNTNSNTFSSNFANSSQNSNSSYEKFENIRSVKNDTEFEEYDFWDKKDMEKSTKEYLQNAKIRAKNGKENGIFKIFFYFIVIFFILNFFVALFDSIKIIKVFG